MNNIPGEIYLYCNKNPVDILVIYSSFLLSVVISVFHFDSFISNTNHIYNKLSNIPGILLDFFFEEEYSYLEVSNEYEYPLEKNQSFYLNNANQDTIDNAKQYQEKLLGDMELSDRVNNLCLPEQIEKSYVKEELLPSESFDLKDWNKLENISDSYYKPGKKENNRWVSLFTF